MTLSQSPSYNRERDQRRHSAFRGRRLPPRSPGDVRRPPLGDGPRQRLGHLRCRRHARGPQDGRGDGRAGRAVHAVARESRRHPRRAGDRVDRRLSLRARRSRVGDRTAGRAEHPHHLADHHRGRLQHRQCSAPASMCSASSRRRWRVDATAASHRRRSCPATTSRATAMSPATPSPPTPSAFIPASANG